MNFPKLEPPFAPMTQTHTGIYPFLIVHENRTFQSPVLSSIRFREASNHQLTLPSLRTNENKKYVHETFSHIFRKAVLDELVDTFAGKGSNGGCTTCGAHSRVESTSKISEPIYADKDIQNDDSLSEQLSEDEDEDYGFENKSNQNGARLSRSLSLALGHSHLKQQKKRSWFCLKCLQTSYTPDFNGEPWEYVSVVKTDAISQTAPKTEELSKQFGEPAKPPTLELANYKNILSLFQRKDDLSFTNKITTKSQPKRFILRLSVEILKEPRVEVMDVSSVTTELESTITSYKGAITYDSRSGQTDSRMSNTLSDVEIVNSYGGNHQLPHTGAPIASTDDQNEIKDEQSAVPLENTNHSSNIVPQSPMSFPSSSSAKITSNSSFQDGIAHLSSTNQLDDIASCDKNPPSMTSTSPTLQHTSISSTIPLTTMISFLWFCTGGLVVILANVLIESAKKSKQWWVESTISSYEKNVSLLLQRGRFDEASALVEIALNYVEMHRGTNHVDFAAFKHLLAQANLGLCNYAHAESLLLQVIHFYEPFGEDAHMARVLEDLALALEGQSRIEESLQVLIKSAKMFEDSHEVDMMLQDEVKIMDVKNVKTLETDIDFDIFTSSEKTTTLSNVLSSAPLTQINEYKKKLISDLARFNSTITPSISTPNCKSNLHSVPAGPSLNLDDFEEDLGSDIFTGNLEADDRLPACHSSPLKDVFSRTWNLNCEQSVSKPCIDAIRVHVNIAKLFLNSAQYCDAFGHCQIAFQGASNLDNSDDQIKKLLEQIHTIQEIIEEKMIVASNAELNHPPNKTFITPHPSEKNSFKTSPDSVTTPLL